ncbi:PQQ-dependent sugar dehydrogenase [Mycetocola manganoxydans]|uniref:PQQ-dependent sugar dehydrogenase n=1 Tax=Mycetocola manganoxydans TaxID=699879 RepID=A0A3L6ZVA6_9MICO|nr:PQQ-dependent sugar dehydrogenase [Mycetocola manganoxydans]RLP71923.1 PQQ-dependent sugar dehydrogenase [Mycetocola manganoxydans]GHD47128.1 oxidoreductase [Mycetocola manganoxydans]
MSRRIPVLVALTAVLLLAGCTASAPLPSERPAGPDTPAPAPSGAPPVYPTGETTVLATGLEAPWSILPLGDSTLLSYRDTGQIMELTPADELREATVVPGVDAGGEGGLLGLAARAEGEQHWIYAYFTASDDNRVVRMPLGGSPGSLTLGTPQVVLDGLAKAGNHNGGRIAFGPDGMLYVTVGDASDADSAQDPGSLNGKILRVTATGDVPQDNPVDGSAVFSLGHRNPQGLAWDADGRLWASEFGQNTWDELNLIEPGGNYGWPVVEGQAGNADFVDPAYQWSTSEASPSGLTMVNNTLFMAALRGERLWGILDGIHVPEGSHGLEGVVSASAYFEGEFGRIRDVAPGPDGTLWLITNNTDGRGSAGPDDDRLIQVELAPLVEG